MSDERASSENNSWVQIVVALIGAIAVILVGYWQFFRKPPDDNQKFVGRVVDEKTEQSIRRAKITLEVKGIPPVIYTDSEGVFTFPFEGSSSTIRLRVEADGYEKFDRFITPSAEAGMEPIELIPLGSDDKSSIVGTYKIVGNNPRIGSYKGTLAITASGSSYQLIWNAAKQPYIGIGILKKNTLAVGWGSKECAVASYQVQSDGSLNGKWAVFDQKEMGLELLVHSSDAFTNDIVSQYTATGKSPIGSAYKETISVQRMGELYQFLRTDSKFSGIGIRKGNTVAVGFGSIPCNVVLYQVQEDGSLTGVWGLYNGSQIGTEEAIR